ncbi:hypothetical protein Q5H92_21750 [Hymenobacter sp. M29]|uniref:Uncharacterized protein n=1 Tax=Hymenobacter mellowenesis TaxID=3063995 RepID=A0ABT9AI42_9BACT|nr:hypothetical protein [Hymenobacter sp. M29]MDO7849004.1 hypothetical protein [Hymenobacter sp. M29]
MAIKLFSRAGHLLKHAGRLLARTTAPLSLWPAVALVLQADDFRIEYSLNPDTGTSDFLRYDVSAAVAYGGFYYRAGRIGAYYRIGIPAGISGVSMQGHKGPDGGGYSVYINNTQVLSFPGVDMYADPPVLAEYFPGRPLNRFDVVPGDVVTVEFTGPNQAVFCNQITLHP